MAALAARKQQPLMIRLPSGELVPLSGGDIAPALAQVAPLAAQNAQGGGPAITAAGQGMVDPLAAAALGEMMKGPQGGGGAARGGALIQTPRQPEVMGGADPTEGSDGALSILKKIGTLAGKTDDTNEPIPSGQDGDSSGGGLMGVLRRLFGSEEKSPVPEVAAAEPTHTGGGLMPMPVERSPLEDIFPEANPQMFQPPQPMSMAATPTTGALPGPTPRPRLVGEGGSAALQPNPVDTMVDTGPIASQTPALGPVEKELDWFGRMKNNPLALALFTGGLQTMSSASRPGATALGSIGEGALGGFGTALSMQGSEQEQELARRKQTMAEDENASQGALRDAQANWYNDRGANDATRAESDRIRADATAKNADTNAAKAAQAFRAGGKTSVFQQKQAAWLASHPGDDQGALDYAAGTKKLGNAEKLKSSYNIANSEMKSMMVQPDDPSTWLDQRADEILARMNQNDAVATPPTKSGPAAPGAVSRIPPGTNPPPAANTNTPGPALGGGRGGSGNPNQGALLDQARAAIKKGADPKAVKERLQRMGGNPGAL